MSRPKSFRKPDGTPKECACGEPAVRIKWGEPVCQRCDEIEKVSNDDRIRRTLTAGVKEPPMENWKVDQWEVPAGLAPSYPSEW